MPDISEERGETVDPRYRGDGIARPRSQFRDSIDREPQPLTHPGVISLGRARRVSSSRDFVESSRATIERPPPFSPSTSFTLRSFFLFLFFRF